MPKPIETKKGTPLFEAAFSFVLEVIVDFYNVEENHHNQFRITKVNKNKHLLADAVKILKEESSVISVENIGFNPMACMEANLAGLREFVKTFAKPDYVVADISIYTENVERIRALAKEVRSDRAVAMAAKKPQKPKADLKTRSDII